MSLLRNFIDKLSRWKWDGVVQASGRQHVLPLFQFKEFRGTFAVDIQLQIYVIIKPLNNFVLNYFACFWFA